MYKYSWLTRLLLFVLFGFSCETVGKERVSKYYIIIERTSKSLLTNQDEREDKLDSVWQQMMKTLMILVLEFFTE
jgi:hypothetical protein